jgi:predicted RNase H-like nuclease (RuvC/YqgF family)
MSEVETLRNRKPEVINDSQNEEQLQAHVQSLKNEIQELSGNLKNKEIEFKDLQD